MAITLIDGTVLPDIPSDVLAEYPYAFVAAGPTSLDTNYQLLAGKSEVLCSGNSQNENLFFFSVVEGFVLYEISSDGSAWVLAKAYDNMGVMFFSYLNEETQYELVWANHDIYYANNEFVSTGEIYFPNSLAKPPFVLPDGTELPALPEGCFEKYPYGVIAKVSGSNATSYALYASSSEEKYETAEDSGIGLPALSAKTNGYIIYILEDVTSDWVVDGPYEDEVCMVPLGEVGAGTESVLFALVWCNHDVLVSADGTLYRKSDVNYRIYGGWLNSMGNQARRLGNVSGELKPGEMESVFSGATLEPLTVTPTTEEQTFTPESPCIGFSVVTVEAAEVEKEIVEVEVIKEYPDAETTVFGNEYVTEAVPTGRYFYGSRMQSLGTDANGCDGSMPEMPSFAGFSYVFLYRNGYNAQYDAVFLDEPAYFDSSRKAVFPSNSLGTRMWANIPATNSYYIQPSAEWNKATEVVSGGAAFWVNVPGVTDDPYGSVPHIVWSNHNIMIGADGSGGVYFPSSRPVPKTVNTSVAKPIEHPGDGMYQISGDTMNTLIGFVQTISGGEAMTPGDAIDYMNDYMGNT